MKRMWTTKWRKKDTTISMWPPKFGLQSQGRGQWEKVWAQRWPQRWFQACNRELWPQGSDLTGRPQFQLQIVQVLDAMVLEITDTFRSIGAMWADIRGDTATDWSSGLTQMPFCINCNLSENKVPCANVSFSEKGCVLLKTRLFLLIESQLRSEHR